MANKKVQPKGISSSELARIIAIASFCSGVAEQATYLKKIINLIPAGQPITDDLMGSMRYIVTLIENEYRRTFGEEMPKGTKVDFGGELVHIEPCE